MNEVAKKGNQFVSFEQLGIIADSVAKSGLFAGIKTKEAAFTLMLLCQSEGMHPIEALKQYDIIAGKPALKADAILARFKNRGGKWEWVETSDTRAAANVNGLLTEFTRAEADRMKITTGVDYTTKKSYEKDNWIKQPATMLRKRLISKAVRMQDPEALLGLMSTEEAIDVRADVAVTSGVVDLAALAAEKKAAEQPETKPTETVIETTATTETEPEKAEEKKPAKTKNFEFLKKMTELKKALVDKLGKEAGEGTYYNLLADGGYEHANEITDREDQVKAFKLISDIIKQPVKSATETPAKSTAADMGKEVSDALAGKNLVKAEQEKML